MDTILCKRIRSLGTRVGTRIPHELILSTPSRKKWSSKSYSNLRSHRGYHTPNKSRNSPRSPYCKRILHCILWRQEYVYRESSNYQDSSEQHYLHPNAIFSTTDIKDFYLNTPLFTFEYMRLPINIIPEEIIEQYNLLPLVINGLVYIEIRKGVYGLPQASKTAHDRLDKYLLQYGYTSTPRTPGLWRHSHHLIAFTFVVDDFGIKSEDVRHTTHFTNALPDLYTITAYPTSSLYCSVTLEWNYAKKYVDVSMPGYVTKVLHKFHHTTLSKPQHPN